MRHVLVVDDEAEICRLVQMGLEREGAYRVTTVRDGGAVVSLIDRVRPDFLILDAVLPGLSGVDLAELAVDRGIPFLVATGHNDLARLLLDEGWPVLKKPFRMATLIRDVEAAIRDGAASAERVRASCARPGRLRALQTLVRRHREPCAAPAAPVRETQKKRALLEEDPDTLRAAFHMIENFGGRAADVAERRAQGASNEEVTKRWLLVARAIRKLAAG